MNIHTLQHNYHNLHLQIAEVLKDSNRSTENLTLVCVSKTVDIETIQTLYQLGHRHFAENRPQIFREKYQALQTSCPEIVWHYVGNLQRRPVKDIINNLDYLHSVDRLSLAKEINKRRINPLKCFVQVNISGEDSKSGFTPQELIEAVESLKELDKLKIIGLMTMAPKYASNQEITSIFKTLSSLQQDIHDLNYPTIPCTELSMGMSQDYTLAIPAGATYIRVGSAFFQESSPQ